MLIATPTTLLALLRTMSCGWREERLAENAQRISDEGRKLHERIATVLEHFADLGTLAQSVGQALQQVAATRSTGGCSSRRAGSTSWTRAGRRSWSRLEEIDVRAATGPSAVADERRAARRRRPSSRSLTLALSPANDERG